MGLRLRREGKKSLIWLFAPFFKSKSLLHQKENEKFGYLRNSTTEPEITEKEKISSFYSDVLLIMCPSSHELHYMT